MRTTISGSRSRIAPGSDAMAGAAISGAFASRPISSSSSAPTATRGPDRPAADLSGPLRRGRDRPRRIDARAHGATHDQVLPIFARAGEAVAGDQSVVVLS